MEILICDFFTPPLAANLLLIEFQGAVIGLAIGLASVNVHSQKQELFRRHRLIFTISSRKIFISSTQNFLIKKSLSGSFRKQ